MLAMNSGTLLLLPQHTYYIIFLCHLSRGFCCAENLVFSRGFGCAKSSNVVVNSIIIIKDTTTWKPHK